MKILILTFALIISSASIASVTCDTTNRIGFQGKILIELAEKTILLTEEGKNNVIFDQHTVCGSPVAGTSDLDCPFITQENDSNLISDLRCFTSALDPACFVESRRRHARREVYRKPEPGSLHNFGFAVDLSILDASGAELDPGSPVQHLGVLP